MRLIDVSEYDLKGGEIYWVEHGEHSISARREPLYKIPTVDAVPMDKLCELLAEHYEPLYSMADIYKLKMPIDFNQQKEIWRAAIIRWMEEQDAKEET